MTTMATRWVRKVRATEKLGRRGPSMRVVTHRRIDFTDGSHCELDVDRGVGSVLVEAREGPDIGGYHFAFAPIGQAHWIPREVV